MAGKRPSLADSMRQVAHAEPPLPPPIAPAPTPVPAAPPIVAKVAEPDPAPKDAPAARRSGFYAATRAGKKKVTVALDPPTHKQLKSLAVEREQTTEALLQEAIADLFRKHGRDTTH